MPTVARLLALLPLAALAACAAAATAAAGGGSEPPLVSSLQVQTYADSVRFVLQVTNAGTAPVAVTFPTGQSADFTVMNDGRPVWRWGAEMGFTQAVRRESFAPGETRTFEATWKPARGTTGEFEARGTLMSSDRMLEQTADFTLP